MSEPADIKKTERTAVVVSVSFDDPEAAARAKARYQRLKPRVASFSHYIRLLIEADIEREAETQGQPAQKTEDGDGARSGSRTLDPLRVSGAVEILRAVGSDDFGYSQLSNHPTVTSNTVGIFPPKVVAMPVEFSGNAPLSLLGDVSLFPSPSDDIPQAA